MTRATDTTGTRCGDGDAAKEPRELIARVGEYVELPSASACCGAAGTYAVLRPDDSARVLDRHLDEIAAADLDAIVVVNPGCHRQLEQGIRRASCTSRSCSRSGPHESRSAAAAVVALLKTARWSLAPLAPSAWFRLA